MSHKVSLAETDILSHLVLEDTTAADLITDTTLWKVHNILEMEIKVNGVDIPASTFRKVMESMWEQAKDLADEAVDAKTYRTRVEARATELVETQASAVMDLMRELENKLQNVDDIVKWDWEE